MIKRKNYLSFIVFVVLTFCIGACSQSNNDQVDAEPIINETDPIDEKINQALLPLPEDLRSGATVYEYDEEGHRIVHRQGDNHVECQVLDERGFNWCYPVASSLRISTILTTGSLRFKIR